MKTTMDTIKNILSKLFTEEPDNLDGSIQINNQQIIEQFLNDSTNPLLVSFPRTGSHWLRMVMELYFKRPSLVRIFYYPDNINYLALHTHDIDLSVERENVIYLYRDPVDTIYSQMNYYKEDIHDKERIAYWTDLYGRHLDKWLHNETFTLKKTVLTYEGMKENMEREFRKITDHFGEQLDRNKLAKAVARITKEEVKKKTEHDPQVVQLEYDYAAMRNDFKKKYSSFVWDIIFANREYLNQYFRQLSGNRK